AELGVSKSAVRLFGKDAETRERAEEATERQAMRSRREPSRPRFALRPRADRRCRALRQRGSPGRRAGSARSAASFAPTAAVREACCAPLTPRPALPSRAGIALARTEHARW